MLNFIRNQVNDHNSTLWAGIALAIIGGMAVHMFAVATGGW